MANVDVTISVIDAHRDLLQLILETPDPGLPDARLNVVDRVTGVSIPIQGITFP